MKQPRLGAAIALACVLTVGGFTALPILALGEELLRTLEPAIWDAGLSDEDQREIRRMKEGG